MPGERGLVISFPMRIEGGRIHVKGSFILSGQKPRYRDSLDQQDLRFSLLFWDKLDFPQNQFFDTTDDAEIPFLISAGVLTRTTIQLPSPEFSPQTVLHTHLSGFRLLDELEPGVWSLGIGENSISFPPQDLIHDKGVLVKLHQALPVPNKDVPLQDILDFRAKRRTELLLLRHHLEDIFQKVSSSYDSDLALNTEIERLDQAVADYIKVSKESRLRFLNMSFGASLNLRAGIQTFSTTYATTLHIPSALMAGAMAAISIGPGASLRGAKATGTPYQ
jgi:hypothetical protein